MARLALAICLLVGCAPARSKVVGRTGMVMALAGVATMIAAAAIESDHDREVMLVGSVASAGGIVAAAAHQLSRPEDRYLYEPRAVKHARWARILTEHAHHHALNGNCARVKKFEPRVKIYDASYHDDVFMRDPDIRRCLAPPVPALVEEPAIPAPE